MTRARVDRVRLEGTCLHAGGASAVTLARAPGPIVLAQDGRAVPLAELTVGRTDEGVTLTDGAGLTVDLVEHLLAALAGTGVYEGLRILVEGPEFPLLDGGARRYVEALAMLGLAALERRTSTSDLAVPRDGPHRPVTAPRLRIHRAAEIRAGDACYRFIPADAVALDVTIAFDHPAIGRQRAFWRGDADDFAERIAPARTFGFTRDLPALLARHRARGAAALSPDVLSALLVFDEHGVVSTGHPPAMAEPATHKLLDLIGDLYVYGGPPAGTIEATRPGHTATHEVIRRALREGIVRA